MKPLMVLRAIGEASVIHLAQYALTQTRVFNIVVTPAAMAAVGALVLVAGGGGRDEALLRVLLGAGVIGMWGSVLVTAVFFLRREHEWYGTFPLLLVSPTPLIAVLAGYLLGEVVLASTGIAFAVLAGSWLAGSMPVVVSGGALVSVLVAAVGVACLALLVAPLMMLLPVLTRWFNVFEFPLWTAAGLMFPIALLPPSVRPLAYGLTPYWSMQSLLASFSGAEPWPALLEPWAMTVLLSLLYLAVAAVLFRVVLARLGSTGHLVGT